MHAIKFTLIRPRTNTKLQPATRDQIQKSRLSGEIDRMPIGRRCHRGAQPNSVGLARPPSKNLKRVGCDCHFQRMMFGRPDDIKTTKFGHLHHLKRVTRHRVHIGAGVHALKIDSELKFHDLTSLAHHKRVAHRL